MRHFLPPLTAVTLLATAAPAAAATGDAAIVTDLLARAAHSDAITVRENGYALDGVQNDIPLQARFDYVSGRFSVRNDSLEIGTTNRMWTRVGGNAQDRRALRLLGKSGRWFAGSGQGGVAFYAIGGPMLLVTPSLPISSAVRQFVPNAQAVNSAAVTTAADGTQTFNIATSKPFESDVAFTFAGDRLLAITAQGISINVSYGRQSISLPAPDRRLGAGPWQRASRLIGALSTERVLDYAVRQARRSLRRDGTLRAVPRIQNTVARSLRDMLNTRMRARGVDVATSNQLGTVRYRVLWDTRRQAITVQRLNTDNLGGHSRVTRYPV